MVVNAYKLPAYGKLRQEDQLHNELEGFKRPCLRKPKEKRERKAYVGFISICYISMIGNVKLPDRN